MSILRPAIVGLLGTMLCLPALSDDNNEAPIDEIVVAGQEFTNALTTIAVEDELIVDSADALRRLPGADRNRNGRLTGIAQYRGMFGDRVPVTIDGLAVVSGGPNAMDAPLSYVSPMITKAIVIERGISSVASAPESIGGHVNAELARGEFRADSGFGVGGMVGARYADNGATRTTAGRFTAGSRSHRVSLIGQLDRGGDVSTPAGKILPSRVSRDRYDLSYAYRNDHTRIEVFAGELDTTDTGTPALAMDIRYIDSQLFGLSLDHEQSPDLSFHAKLGYNDVDHVMDNFALRTPPEMPARFRQNRALGNGSNAALSLAWQRGDYLVTTGVDGRFATHDSVITNPNNAAFEIQNFTDVSRDLVSAFAVISSADNRASWEAGLRYSHVAADAGEVSAAGMMAMMGMNAGELAARFNAADRSRTFDNVDAVAKFAYQFSPRLRAGFDIGSKTRAPSYQELYLWLPLQATGGLADGRNYIGNLELESERSAEVALSLDWTGERLAVSPQAYYKRVADYIQGVPAELMPANMLASMMSGAGALMFDNVDAEIYGVDLGWQYRLTSTLRLEGNAAYVRGRRTDLDDNLYRLPPANGSVALRYARDALSLRAEVVGYGAQDKVAAYNDEQESAGYGVVNASMAWRLGAAVRLQFQASNIFDRGYQDHLAGVNRVRDVDIPVGERLWGEGRTLTVGAVMSF